MNKFMISLVEHIGFILHPLLENLIHPKRFSRLLRKHGWDTSSANTLAVMDEVKSRFKFDQLNTTLDSLSQLLISDIPFNWEDVEDILSTLKYIIISIKELSSPIATGVAPFNDAKFWEEFSAELLDELIIDYIASRKLSLFLGLRFFGLIKVEPRNMDGVAGRLSYLKRSIEWGRLNDQPQLFRDTYRWDSFDQDYPDFILQIMLLLNDAGFYNRLDEPDPNLIEKYYGINPVPLEVKQIYVPLIKSEGEVPVDLSLLVLPIPNESKIGNPVGFALGTTLKGILDQFELGNFIINISGILGTDRKALIEVRPSNISLDLFDNSPDEINASIIYKKEDYLQPEIILGNPDGTRIEIERIKASIDAKGSFQRPEFEIVLGIPRKGGKLVIAGDDGDGFIQKILPENPITINFDIILGYSLSKGFYVKGGAGFEYTFQINKSLGPIFINTLDLKLDLTGGEIAFMTAVTGGVQIGPITAVVEKIGLKTLLELGKPGILGKADLSLDFKPPSGIGLALDVGSVKGGGFLSIDPPNYAGILELSVENQFAVTAFGLLTTKLPDGKPGFSLLLSLMAEFSPPIQLSFGFALVGVGGLIGINRQMKEKALREALKNHSLDSILFPKDPLKDAVKIITAIKSIFRPRDGYHVFGPMVKIIWGGTKKLVEFELGIFVEIGGPVRVALLGLAHSSLPNEEKPIVILNMDILGFIDFGNKTLAIDSSLFNSTLLNKFTLSGEMALRSNWGDNPDFALSLGGFYPGFSPPPGFPKLKRLMISLGDGNPRISLSSYFAITTNTLQTGALLDLWYKKKGCTVSAGLGFDALIKFSPFFFEVDMMAWVTLKGGPISILTASLDLLLTGPNPFRAKGYAKFKILFFKLKVKFDKTFGKKVPEIPPTASPADALRGQLVQTNPRAVLPSWTNEGVVLTKDAASLLSPLGAVEISQNVVPLEFQMDIFGGGVPDENESRLSLEVTSNGSEICDPTVLPPPKAGFAPAQFKKMSDHEKISAPPFENYLSGVRICGQGATPKVKESKAIGYESFVVNPTNNGNNDNSSNSTSDNANNRHFLLTDLTDSTQARSLRDIWSLQGAKKHFRPANKVPDEESSNFIRVVDPEFTVTLHEAENGKFRRIETRDGVVGNMTYFQAVDLARKSDPEDVIVRDVIGAADQTLEVTT